MKTKVGWGVVGGRGGMTGGMRREDGARKESGDGAAARVEVGGGAVAFIFSLPHVIFIVNKTHLAFLSEQGLAGEASILAEKQAVG